MPSPTRRSILIRLLGAASAWLVGAGRQRFAAAPVGRDDPVKRVLEAWNASVKAIQSGTAVVTFETYVQEPEDKELRLWSKGQADVYFDGRKNHVRYVYETKLGRERRIGQAEVKIVERKPRDLAVIYDGTMAQVVTFRGRDNRFGCTIEIYSSLNDCSTEVTEVKGDPTQFWLSQVGVQKAMKTVKRDEIKVADLGGGAWRFHYEPFKNSKDRFEIEASAKAAYNPVRFRVVNPNLEKPALDYSAKWTKSGGVWHIEELVMDERYHSEDEPSQSLNRSILRYKSFKPNSKVDAKLFTLDCLNIPPRSRTFDRRPQESG